MRNTYKYTQLYSGGIPEFIEGDVFRTIIPLTPVAVEKVGLQEKTHDRTHDKTHDAILAFCVEPRSKAEIAEHCGYKNTKNFTQKYLRPLLDSGMLKMTLPDKPKAKIKNISLSKANKQEAGHRKKLPLSCSSFHI